MLPPLTTASSLWCWVKNPGLQKIPNSFGAEVVIGRFAAIDLTPGEGLLRNSYGRWRSTWTMKRPLGEWLEAIQTLCLFSFSINYHDHWLADAVVVFCKIKAPTPPIIPLISLSLPLFPLYWQCSPLHYAFYLGVWPILWILTPCLTVFYLT